MRIRLLLAFGTLWCSIGCAQDWQYELRGDLRWEDQSPRFALIRDDASAVEVRDGLIMFRIPSAEAGAYLGIGVNPAYGEEEPVLGDARAWNGRAPTTVEARLRVLRLAEGAAAAAQLSISDGHDNWLLNISPGGLPGLALDATEFHTYRLTIKEGIANLYVDGRLAPDSCLYHFVYGRNGILIGDISSSAGGDSDWEYVRWTNREATPWELSEERQRQMERNRVVVGDQPGDVEEANISPPFGEVATLPDGRVMSWFPRGKAIKADAEAEYWIDEPGVVQRAFARFSEDNGVNWGRPVELFEFPEQPGARTDGMALVTRSGAVHLWGLRFLYCPLKPPYPYEKAVSALWHARSPDGKSGWVVQDVDFGHPYTGASNSALQLSSGRILVPISRYSNRPTGRFVTCVPYSDDDGVTWHRPVDEIVVNTGGEAIESGACEPVATELGDGRVWMLIRAQDGYQWESFSSDGGLHWSEPVHSRFVSTNSPAAVLRLHDGRIIVVWNNCGPDNLYHRLVVCAAISADDGKTWAGYRELARVAQDGVLSYPYMTEARDGKVVLVLMQGSQMLRFDPSFLTRTEFQEDFRDGLGRWSQLGTEGAETVPDPDGGAGRVLRLRKPNPAVPGGVCLNFPFGRRGEITLGMRLEPGCKGAHFALTDHFDPPGRPKDGAFAWRITAQGELETLGGDKVYAPTGVALQAGKWHELRVVWDCASRSATFWLDGVHIGHAPQLSAMPGICYLRLRPLSEETDEAGLYVGSVQTRGEPG